MRSLQPKNDAPQIPRTGHFRNPNFSESTTATLRAWLEAHKQKPYPTKRAKRALMRKTGISRKQLDIWFTNARKVATLFLILCLVIFTADSQFPKAKAHRSD